MVAHRPRLRQAAATLPCSYIQHCRKGHPITNLSAAVEGYIIQQSFTLIT
jgi:hypothetical protein